MIRFNSVVLDVDSTLTGIEGIDWLASLRGAEVRDEIARLTDQAMQGAIPLETVYGRRLEAVRPSRTEVAELARQYVENIAPNAKETLARLRARGVEVVLVSGGLREAILPLATEIGLKEDAVNAVPIFFNARGEYTGFDKDSALARQNGKRETVSRLNLPQRILAVGDGMTDTEMRACADTFAAYTGFVRREAVVAKADLVIEDFRQLEDTVLG